MESPKEFLMRVCGCGESDHINYKPVENGSLVEAIHIDKAVEKLEHDIKEMKEFFKGFNVDGDIKEKATLAAYDIWSKHLVVWRDGNGCKRLQKVSD